MKTAAAALLLLAPATVPGDMMVAASEVDCEDKGFDQSQCAAVGCCEWDDGQCWSGNGNGPCGGAAPSTEGIVLPTYAKGAFSPTWIDGARNWQICHKTSNVFGVTICVTQPAWDDARPELDHVVGVLAQLIDNDADGVADDPDVVKVMVAGNYFLIVPATEEELENMTGPFPAGVGQMTGTFEAFPNSCDIPKNRGASHTDRSTWAATVENTPGATGCDPRRDATFEEVLHLITTAAAAVFPEKWAPTATSAAGKASFAANGDCGWGYSDDWKDPGGDSPACSGQYAYSDETCDVGCVVIEGIYWASASYVGGLMTDARARSVSDEWLMTVADASMADSVPAGIANAKTLQEGSPALYALVSDTTSVGHKWLPAVMPTGSYAVTSSAATASLGMLPDDIDGDSKATAPSDSGDSNVQKDANAAQSPLAGSVVAISTLVATIIGLVC